MNYEGAECHEPHNVGNPGEFTMLELAKLVQELVGSSTTIKHEPLPSDDPKQRRPNIQRAEKNLGWAPTIPLREGLKRTIANFDQRLKAGEL
jgi:nucleoside-diphosphate-sugar epimerase